MALVLTIDEGTTSTRALVVDSSGKILNTAQKEFRQIFPKPGWVEHDALDIWHNTETVCRQAIKNFELEDFAAIAITNQRETTVVWNKHTGLPVYNAIVWQCRRTADYCQTLKAREEFSELIFNKTGLLIDSYFSGPKLTWILDSIRSEEIDIPELKDASPDTIEKYIRENLLFGTIDTWLLWKLSEGKAHKTESSNASRTMLYNLKTKQWDQEILSALNIPVEILPEIVANNACFAEDTIFDIPVKAMLGDQQAALYAYKNPSTSSSKVTYGTGCFALMETSEFNSKVANPQDNTGLLCSSAFHDNFSVEGSIFVGGALIQWLRDGLKIIDNAAAVEELAASVKDNGGVYIIPALAGLAAPYWREDVQGSIHGITRGTTRAHIARAALEAIAFRVKDIFEALKHSIGEEEFYKNFTEVNVDGGACKNDLLMQFQADLLGIPIKRYRETEMTALGVAKMTGEVKLELVVDKVFEPDNISYAIEQYEKWRRFLPI